MTKAKDDIWEMVCEKCGAEVSGPDKDSVEETMARHACGGKKKK
jgi:hypothetical protein